MPARQKISLNGTWKLWGTDSRSIIHDRQIIVNPAQAIEATVPGEVHLDLWKQGLIDDPYTGSNVLKARWVEETVWVYQKDIDVPPEALQARAWLNFEGLDLGAAVYLNNALVGRHDNAFVPCRIEVTGKLWAGINALQVQLESGLFSVNDKHGKGYTPGGGAELPKRFWLRKPQFQFGWDWAPRLGNVGIYKPAWLEWTPAAARLDQCVFLAELSDDLAAGTLRCRLFIEGLSRETTRATLQLELPEAGIRSTAEVELQPGLHPYEVALAIAKPKLWWPIGHGEQHRYAVQAAVQVGSQRQGAHAARIGFRHVRINQDPHPVSGRYFIVEINRKKIFAKGGNFVPADMIYARLDRQRYVTLVDRAIEANYNILRVWGGGLYESDDFYDLCDEKGILTWQEFIFACRKYPAADPEFHNNILAEARCQIRRLAGHPSLIVWCGNNEMEWHYNKGSRAYDRGDIVLPDNAFFHLTLPRLLAEEDPTRYYQPSSPFSPDHLPPNQDDVGDQHPYSVTISNPSFYDYRKMICRFPNEGAFMGPTSLPTMLACLPENERAYNSFAWRQHTIVNLNEGRPDWMQALCDYWLGMDCTALDMEAFVYWTGLLQGEAMREFYDNFRRRMFDSAGAIYWMFNDCWPATLSWTIVDYYLRRTPAFMPVKRSLAPIHTVIALEGNDVAIFGINDTAQPVPVEMRYGVFNLSGGFPLERRGQAALAPNASTRLASFPVQQWKETDRSAAFAVLDKDGLTLARNRLLLHPFKDLQWPEGKVSIRQENGFAIFESRTFAWGICLDLRGETPLADNFFDVYPGIPYRIPWAAGEPPRILETGNRIVELQSVQSIRRFMISKAMPSAGKLHHLCYPENAAELHFTEEVLPYPYWDVSRSRFSPGRDELVYFLCEFECKADMQLNIALGYDGPVKLWFDRQACFHDPNGVNPAVPDKAVIQHKAAKGKHEALVALGSNSGKAGCVFFKINRGGK